MNKSRKQLFVFFLEIIVTTVLYMILDTAGFYKYIVVVLYGSVSFLWKKEEIISSLKENTYIFLPILIYCGLGLCFSVLGGNQTIWTIKTVVFLILPPMFSLSLYVMNAKDKKHMVDIQFWSAVLCYFITKAEYILSGWKVESAFAFVFGLFGIYYIWRQKWLRVLIALVVMHFANKRIAVLAVIACVCLMLFFSIVKYSSKWIYIIWGILMTAVGTYLYTIFSGILVVLCEKFGINTMTRIDIYMKIVDRIPQFQLRGRGLGSVNELLAELLSPDMFNHWYQNPHNDFLKIYLELGAIGWVFFMASYLIVFYIAEHKKTHKRALSQLFITIVYFMVLMATDNVSIYILFLVPMYSICLALANERTD